MLFNVQDSDRPMFVIANDWNEAVEKWRAKIRDENDISPNESIEGPDGVQLLAEDNEIIL